MSAISVIQGLIKGSDGVFGVAQRKRVTLTSAQVLALFTTPVSIVPAPGAGKGISVLAVDARVNFNSIAYAGANALEVRYTNGAGTKVSSDLAAAFVNNASSRADRALGVAATITENAAVVVAVPVANPTAGNSTITIDVLYRVVG